MSEDVKIKALLTLKNKLDIAVLNLEEASEVLKLIGYDASSKAIHTHIKDIKGMSAIITNKISYEGNDKNLTPGL